MKNIEALIDDGGEITLGALPHHECAAAADGSNALAMLVRRNGKTPNALLKRLDQAVGAYCDDGETVEEVNGP
jgi:hypothetical protein